MVVIDGRESDINVGQFANLDEVLVRILEDEAMGNRIVTDVLLNDEAFSELYPYQAEDIESKVIEKLEVRSVSVEEMAAEVTIELYKVIEIMSCGAKEVACLFRQAEVGSGLEVLKDVIDVTRHFLATIAMLRSDFSINRDEELLPMTEELGDVIEEICSMIEQEDWVIVADLAEFELVANCNKWNSVLKNLAQDIARYKAA